MPLRRLQRYSDPVANAFGAAIYYIHPWDVGSLALYLYAFSRRLFRHFAITYLATSYVGLAVYALWPVAPPWLAYPQTVERKTVMVEKWLAGYGITLYREPNRFSLGVYSNYFMFIHGRA